MDNTKFYVESQSIMNQSQAKGMIVVREDDGKIREANAEELNHILQYYHQYLEILKEQNEDRYGRFNDHDEAFVFLRNEGFTCIRGILKEPEDLASRKYNPEIYQALNYLCNEWDYAEGVE